MLFETLTQSRFHNDRSGKGVAWDYNANIWADGFDTCHSGKVGWLFTWTRLCDSKHTACWPKPLQLKFHMGRCKSHAGQEVVFFLLKPHTDGLCHEHYPACGFFSEFLSVNLGSKANTEILKQQLSQVRYGGNCQHSLFNVYTYLLLHCCTRAWWYVAVFLKLSLLRRNAW